MSSLQDVYPPLYLRSALLPSPHHYFLHYLQQLKRVYSLTVSFFIFLFVDISYQNVNNDNNDKNMLKENNLIMIFLSELSLILSLHDKYKYINNAYAKVFFLTEQGVRVQSPFEKSLWHVKFPGHSLVPILQSTWKSF